MRALFIFISIKIFLIAYEKFIVRKITTPSTPLPYKKK